MRLLLITCSTLMTAVIAIGYWIVVVPHTPSLWPKEAGALIAARPEFYHGRTLMRVTETTRYKGSLQDVCYYAEFVFRSDRTGGQVAARANFTYSEPRWHLSHFDYGTEPHVENIEIPESLSDAK